MNPGILTSGYAPPPMPYGLLGSPRAVPMTDPYGYDADAARYIEAVEQADRQRLELAVRLAINAFVVGCKADGIWSAIKSSCILLGARTLSGALTPLVGAAPTNNNFVSGDYNRKTGPLGDGGGKILDSNRINTADPLNSQHISFYVTQFVGSPSNRRFMGDGGATGNTSIGAFITTENFGTRSRNSNVVDSGVTMRLGLFAVSRSSATEYKWMVGNVSGTQQSVSQVPAAISFQVFAGRIQNGHSGRAGFYSIGESLDLALLNRRVSALHAAIGVAIP